MAMQSGDLLFLSGHVCRENGEVVTGRVGAGVAPQRAQQLARSVAIDLLATINAHCGLEAVRQVVKLTGYVRSAEEFSGQPAVLNGASDLMAEVFGAQHGRHARAAIGVSELPGGAAIEIEAIVRIG